MGGRNKLAPARSWQSWQRGRAHSRMKALLGTVVVENQEVPPARLVRRWSHEPARRSHTPISRSGQLGVQGHGQSPDIYPIRTCAQLRGGSHLLCDSGPPFGARPKPHGACGYAKLILVSSRLDRPVRGYEHLSGELFKTLTKTDIQTCPIVVQAAIGMP